MPEKSAAKKSEKLAEINGLIDAVSELLASRGADQELIIKGDFKIPDLGIDLTYVAGSCTSCSGGCTSCSGCSACSGCTGCSNTNSVSHSAKIDQLIFPAEDLIRRAQAEIK